MLINSVNSTPSIPDLTGKPAQRVCQFGRLRERLQTLQLSLYDGEQALEACAKDILNVGLETSGPWSVDASVVFMRPDYDGEGPAREALVVLKGVCHE